MTKVGRSGRAESRSRVERAVRFSELGEQGKLQCTTGSVADAASDSVRVKTQEDGSGVEFAVARARVYMCVRVAGEIIGMEHWRAVPILCVCATGTGSRSHESEW